MGGQLQSSTAPDYTPTTGVEKESADTMKPTMSKPTSNAIPTPITTMAIVQITALYRLMSLNSVQTNLIINDLMN